MTKAEPRCPFCLGNDLFKGEILAKSAHGYLTEDNFNPGNYLIIPMTHNTSPYELSDMWWADVKTLMSIVPGLSDQYNVSLNIGSDAGQSLKHLHFWVIPRLREKPSSGKGLTRFIAEADAA